VTDHFVSVSCKGTQCFCGKPATHKVGEEILHDDPNPNRHNLTAYVCCEHFRQLMGPAVPCVEKRCRTCRFSTSGKAPSDEALAKCEKCSLGLDEGTELMWEPEAP
jgi:hypothetical protein